MLATVCPEDVPNCSGLLDFNLTLVVQLAIFIATAGLLWFVLWRPVVQVIEARERTFAEGRRAAEEAERALREADAQVKRALERARVEARELIGAASKEAGAGAEQARARARAEAEQVLTAARGDIGRERDQALAGLHMQTEALVLAATEAVVGRSVSDERLRAAVHEVAR